jgi:hypothetical protein
LNPNPFLFSNSKKISGKEKAIVYAVGENSMLSRYRKEGSLQIKE